MAIRNAAKAIILHNNRVLVNRCKNAEYDVFYDLPGGGQHQFETMEEAVVREVLEETGYPVTVKRFLALAEEIYDDPKTREKYYDYSHRILHIFLVELANESPQDAVETDFQQETSVWMSLDEVDSVPFHPMHLSGKISSLIASSTPQYLGYVRIP